MKVSVLDRTGEREGLYREALEPVCGKLDVLQVDGEEGAPDAVLDSEVVIVDHRLRFADRLRRFSKLKGVIAASTGFDHIDVDAMRERGVVVCNAPDYATASTAQFAFARILATPTVLLAEIPERMLANWYSRGTTFQAHPVGLVGFGRIGQHVAGLLNAVGIRPLVHTRNPAPQDFPEVDFTSFESLLRICDIVSLHTPLTPNTRGMIDEEALRLMGEGSILVNTARGELVKDESMLAEALREGRLLGAALDTFAQEPLTLDSPLIGLPNCILSPHAGASTLEAQKALMASLAKTVQSFQEGGEILNVV